MDFEVNNKGDFPLGIACGRSSAEVALLILDNPTVDVHKVDKIGANCFWLACEGGKSEILPTLIEKGINYLIKTTDGRNGLHVATKNNHKNVLDYLISTNFPLNIRVNGGYTSLAIASELGHFDIVKKLITAGANINKLSEKGDGALLKAIENNHSEIARFLVENGAKMVLSTKYRNKSPLFLVIETQNVDMLKIFKKHNVDLTAKTSSGQSLLKFAADKGLTKIMNYLIKRMPNLDQEDDTGFTIFTKYLLRGEFDICKNLIKSGCNINHININGKTPLHLALECRKLSTVEFLLQNNANPHIENFYGEDICEKVQKHNIILSDEAMFPLIQCRPDRRVKLDPLKIMEEHKEEENKMAGDEESSDDGKDKEEMGDQESMAYQNQTSSSESETENSEMMMTGSSFWVSEIAGASPSAKKSKFAEEIESSDKFIAKLEEQDQEEIPKIVIKSNNLSFKSMFLTMLNKKKGIEEPAKPAEPIKQNSNLLSPDKDDYINTNISFTSQVSNPFHIKIIEQNENSELISKKSRNSSLKASSKKNLQNKDEDKDQDQDLAKAELMNNTADTGADSAERKGSEEEKKPKKKKKKKKKAAQNNEDEIPKVIVADETVIPDETVKPDETEQEKQEEVVETNPEPVQEIKPEEVKVNVPVEDIKLHGLKSIDMPVNLDKYLLSDQTNSVLKKYKKKKKKKKNNGDETADPESKTGTAPTQESSIDKPQLGELKGVPKRNSGRDTGSTVLAGSVESNGKRSSNSSFSNPNNKPIMDGGDMDVKTYMKTIKQIENEKEQYKKEVMSNSLSSKADKKASRYS